MNNSGNHKRDFTYIGDVVDIMIKLMKKKLQKFKKLSNQYMFKQSCEYKDYH